MTHKWKVVPLSKGQLLDVRPEDIVRNGHFRMCSTYRGGGGYDRFPLIAEKRFGTVHRNRYDRQFIVQLFGCNLDCPYCYVTREGVWGQPVEYSTDELINAFYEAREAPNPPSVFHLMGGAPALQLKFWPELIDQFLSKTWYSVFHSDLMLSESLYDIDVLREISKGRCLFAVDVKGLDHEEHLKNTRKRWNDARFWHNLDLLEQAKVPYYITFTACSPENIHWFWSQFAETHLSYEQRLAEAFSIDLIDYDALPHVDDIPWGGKGGLSVI